MFLTSYDAQRDITMSYGVLDVLDHSSPTAYSGTKIGIDLTSPVANESKRNIKKLANVSEEKSSEIEKWILENVDCAKRVKIKKGFVAVAVEKAQRRGKDILQQLMLCPEIKEFFRAIVIFDENVDIENNSKILWKVFNNTDPNRDIIIDENIVFIDACKKNLADGHQREWPDDLTFDK